MVSGQPNVTPLDKNKYCVNALQCMATKCEMDKKGVLLFSKSSKQSHTCRVCKFKVMSKLNTESRHPGH